MQNCRQNAVPPPQTFNIPYPNSTPYPIQQIELDRTAEAFKVLHYERQGLVKQWQDAIDTMRRRDVEINEIAEKFAGAKKIREAKFEVLE